MEVDMAVIERNEKRTSGKSILFVSIMLACFAFPAAARQKGDFYFGLYTGWAVGFKPEFAWHTASIKNDYNLNFHTGVYVQFNQPEHFGIQLNLNYQNGSNPWTFYTYSEDRWTSGTDSFSFSSANLNFVLNYARSGNSRFYLLAGAGISTGSNMYHFDDSFINFVGGTGVKIHLKQGLRTAVNLGLTFHHLWDPRKYGDAHANLIRFNIGLETALNKKRN
jgi:opacity protein-like surface antigen